MDSRERTGRSARLVSDIGVFLVGTALAKMIQFVLMPLYTSYMTTEAYGVAEIVNGYTELLFPIITLCIYEAAFRFAVESDFPDAWVLGAIRRTVPLTVGMCSILYVILRVFVGYPYSLHLVVIALAYSLRMTLAYYVRGCGRTRVFAVSGIVNALALCLSSIVSLVCLRMSTNGYLSSIMVSYVVSAAYLFFRGGVAAEIRSAHIERPEYLGVLRYCTPLVVYNVLYWVITISGRYILELLAGSSDVGLYVAAVKISAVVNVVGQAVYTAFQLNTARAYEESDREQYLSGELGLFTDLYIVGGSVVVALTPLISLVTLRGDFAAASVYVPMILLGAIANCISSLFSTIYTAYKETRRTIPISLAGALINVVVCFGLIPIFGIGGTCVAGCACYLSQMFLKAYDVSRFTGIHLVWAPIARLGIAFVVEVGLMSFGKGFHLAVACFLSILVIVVFYKRHHSEIKDLLASLLTR